MGVLRIVVLIAAASGAQLGGCGSSDSTSPATPTDCRDGCWTLSAADEEFFTQACTLIEACCITNSYRTAAAADVEGCKNLYRKAGLSTDAGLRATCLADLKSLAATGQTCVPESWDLSEACLRLTYEPSGPQAPGEPCVNRADCKGAPGKVTFCSTSDASPTHALCIRLTRGVAGSRERCLGTVSPDGLLDAGPMDVTGQAKPVTTGPVCEERAGLVCEPGDNLALWTCQPLTADGATCNYSTYCASRQCLKSDGTDASYDQAGTCTTRVPVGQVCADNVTHALCDAASYCQDTGNDPFVPGGICVAKLAVGAACQNDNMCLSGTCDLDTTHTCSTMTNAERLSLIAFCGRF